MPRLLALVLLLLPALAQARVGATTPILQDLVRQVGGERVQAVGVVPLGADPHGFDLTPATARALSGVRLLFANGLGLEPFLPRLKALLPPGARVVELAPGQPDLICGLRGLREKGVHIHGDCDPHLWLDPRYAIRYAETIAQELTRLDPRGEGVYRRNLEAFRAQVLEEDRKTEACLKGKGLRVVATHLSLLYWARRYGVEIVGTLLDTHARETGPRERITLLEAGREGRIDLLIAEPQFPRAKAEALARELGAPLVVLYTDALDRKVPTYLDLLKHNRQAFCP